MNGTGDAGRNGRFSAGDTLGIVAEGQTYKNLLYLVLAFPLGFAYWLFLMFGFVFGLVLLVMVIGIAIFIGTVVGVRLIARFERWLASALLTLDLREPDDRPATDEIWSTIRGYLDAPSTWRGLGFLMVKSWLGVVGLVLFFFLWNAVELLTAPLRYPYGVEFGTVNGQPLTWTIGTLPEALLAVPTGILVGVAVLNVSNGFAYVAERMAIALLGESGQSEESATEP